MAKIPTKPGKSIPPMAPPFGKAPAKMPPFVKGPGKSQKKGKC